MSPEETAATRSEPNSEFAISLQRREGKSSRYVIKTPDGTQVGQAQFIDADGARIFYHTVVDPEYGGQGLGTRLVKAGLQGAQDEGLAVVPVCSMFARYLDKRGAEYREMGGQIREPNEQDIATIEANLR